MRLDFEWLEAPGVRDEVLAATWARFSLVAGDRCASESIDLRSDSRRTGIYGTLFPLAEWIIENWWYLLHESATGAARSRLSSPHSPVLGARAAPPLMRSWMQRHNLLAARDGGSLPDLTITRDEDAVWVQWTPDPVAAHPTRLRFVGDGSVREDAAEFERSLSSFVDSVLGRLTERLPGNETVERALEEWGAVRSADSEESELCRALAMIGIDPYDPSEATEPLVATTLRAIKSLAGELRTDLFDGSDPLHLAADLKWVDEAATGLRGTIGDLDHPTIEPVVAPTAYEVGYYTARRVRADLLGLSPTDRVPDLTAVLVDGLGWARDCSRTVTGESSMDGIIGVDEASAPLLLTPDARSEAADRFRLARAAFFPVTRRLGSGGRLLTRSVTHPQRAARAFAAELLAPAAALADRVSVSLNDQDVEELSTEFGVDSRVIRHQVENHRLAYLET